MRRSFPIAVLGSFVWGGCIIGFDADQLTGGDGPTAGGVADTNIAPSGTGYTWSKNRSSASDANRAAAARINDGNLSDDVNVNPNGEGGAAIWEAAGVVWSSPKTLSSVQFVNGVIDRNDNGYFESNCTLQLTNDGTSWVDSGWAITPSYPHSAAAGGRSYSFSGAVQNGVVGARVTGKTGSSSWSWIVNEVALIGH